jgi:undecaprenyl-phosphate 4-deoxy-4-formamido-L-arabinose transferase
MTVPALSVVVPVFNEEEVLEALFDRLYRVLDELHEPYEIVFINDGSADRSGQILAAQFHKRPDVTRVVQFNGNFGQHMAIMAGFARSRGAIVITLDADLQNPPEEIPRLMAEIRKGHDYVGTVRRIRNDTVFRKVASKTMNWMRERTTRIKMTDQGCMLRAYERSLVETLNACREVNTFIPALAYLQWFSLVGMLLSGFSAVLFVVLLVRRFMLGAEVEGVFTLFALQFFLTGILLFGIGLMGEYVGRIQQEVRRRPRYRISAVLEAEQPDSGGNPP